MMEEDKENLPFEQVLDALLGSDEVKIPQLFRLSDMKPDDQALFFGRWDIASGERRAEIAQHLADLSEENFEVEFSPVFARCLQDDEKAVRKSALDGLWDSSNTGLITPISQLMQDDPSVLVRKTAAATLAHYVLMGEWGQIAASAKDRTVDALLAEYRSNDTPIEVKRAALEALGPASHEDVPSLILDAYESSDRRMQASALFAMGTSADERWLGTLIDEMENPYEEIRAEAARAAGEIGDSDAVSPLSELLYDDDIDVQKAAVYALGKIGSDQAEQVLNSVLEDEDAGELYESIQEALEQSDWLGSDVDLGAFDLGEIDGL